jgi:hypothetical protein
MFDALDGVDVGVQVADPHPVLEQVVGEVLRHLLGQRGDQHPLVGLGALADLLHQVVDLAGGGTHHHLRVHQPGGADDLLGDRVGLPALVGARAWPR